MYLFGNKHAAPRVPNAKVSQVSVLINHILSQIVAGKEALDNIFFFF